MDRLLDGRPGPVTRIFPSIARAAAGTAPAAQPPLAPSQTDHLLSRVAFGPTPTARAAVAAKGPQAWVIDQLAAGNALPADGEACGDALLRYLAAHPATAQRLGARMCVRYVSDSPSAELVAAVAKAYLDGARRSCRW